MNKTLSLIFFTAWVASCHNGGGGSPVQALVIDEAEPNDSAAQANGLAVGESGHGTVVNDTDTDVWQVTLSADEVVSIEVFGNRFDFTTWVGAGNAPKVSLFDTDGTTLLLQQGDERFNWNPNQDTDLLAFRAPATGTYFVQIDVADALAGGGEYLVSIQDTTFTAPLQFELEPAGAAGSNDDELTAETIVPGTVYGFHVDDEQDWYQFTVANPSLVTFTMHAHRNGVWQGDDDVFDPKIQLLDSLSSLLTSNDDAFYLDSSVQHVLTAPATYFFRVEECCGTGDSDYTFEFTLDELTDLGPVTEVEPNDDALTAQSVQFGSFIQGNVTSGNADFYAFSCNAGDRIYLQVFDLANHAGATDSIVVSIEDALAGAVPTTFGSNFQFHRTILTDTGTFFAQVTTSGSTDYALRITQLPAGFETEPNDVVANAGTFDANGLAAGAMDAMDDADKFSFAGTQGVPVKFECFAGVVGPSGFSELNGFGSTMNPVLSVMDFGGGVLATSTAFVGTSVGVKDGLAALSLVFLPPTSGTFYVEVTDEGSGFGADSTYVLQRR